jgi:hypothetical protein
MKKELVGMYMRIGTAAAYYLLGRFQHPAQRVLYNQLNTGRILIALPPAVLGAMITYVKEVTQMTVFIKTLLTHKVYGINRA